MFNRCFRSVLSTLFLVSIFGAIAGCNTIHGAGKDIEQAGKAIKDEAAAVKQKM